MREKMRFKKMSVILIVLSCAALGVAGQLLMKKGMNNVGVVNIKDVFSLKVFPILFEKYVFVGFLIYVVASLLWLVALSQEELNFIYPLIASGYIITAILSKFLFNESLSMFRFLGILLICGGVYLIVIKI
jgi:multidrug transporter EmrE-like cation transporter